VTGFPFPRDIRRAAAAIGLAAALLAIGEGVASAQDQVSVRAQVDRLEMSEGEDVHLTVEIVGPGLDRVGPPDMTVLEDFDISGGPAVSTRYQWINGVSNSSRTYTYELTPKKLGKATIPSLGVLVQGRTLRTRPIDVIVAPRGAIRAPNQPPAAVPRGAVPRGAGPPGGGQGRQTAPIALRLRAEVDNRSAYVGQQITLRLVLDTQTEVLNAGPLDNPSFPGFWAEEIKLPDQPEVRRVTLDGAPWNEITLMKRALFATTSGSLSIPPMAWQVQIRRRSTDPFESFFFTPTESVTRRSDPVTITALPLPAAGKPAGFSGAVGNFTLAVTADRATSRVNDAVGLKIKVAGEGSLGSVVAPAVPEMSDFKRFDPKISSTSSVSDDRLRSEKVWDYVVIPLAPGTQTLPPVEFSYFDPKTRAYRSVASPPVTIQVAKGDETPGSTLPVVAQSDVRLLRREMHYLKLAPEGLRDRSHPFRRSPLFLVLLFVPVAVDLSLWGWAGSRDRSPGAARARRERRARRVARRRLRDARRQMRPQTARAFYASVACTMTDYVGDKFGAAGAGLTHEKIEELLAGSGASEDLRAATHRCLEACDFARFAPSSSGVEEMRRTLASAEETLAGLERSLDG
jgi:hypothetical protein